MVNAHNNKIAFTVSGQIHRLILIVADCSNFAGAVSAWQSRNASSVRQLIPNKQRLTLDLEGTGEGRVTGRPTAENAEAVLKDYFSKVDEATLKDVTSADSKTFTRTYDYTYRPTGAAVRTTRLSFTLTPLKNGGYGLVGVEERPKKS